MEPYIYIRNNHKSRLIDLVQKRIRLLINIQEKTKERLTARLFPLENCIPMGIGSMICSPCGRHLK